MMISNKLSLWLRWVVANAFGELIGLGSTLVLIGLVAARLDGQPGATEVLFLFFIAIACGAVEATIAGLAQWWAMHPWFPHIARRTWWLATLAGALLAYGLGFLPSTLMNLGEQTSQGSPVAEPPKGIVLLFAGVLGAVAGAVLSFAQWLAMRNKVARAGWWMPANMLAWMVGMPLIFWGIDAAQTGPPAIQAGLLMAGVLLFAGAAVGAIHGAFLVRLVEPHYNDTVVKVHQPAS